MPVYSTFDQATLDREYSPSSCVDDINVYLQAYSDTSLEVKRRAVEENSCALDLSYGTSDDETLDLFFPREPARAPLHIFVHGGYWRALSKNDSSFAAPMFQESGACFAALNYSLAPTVSLTEIVEQVRRSICWLYQNAYEWGFNRDEIYLSGSSAGAHLVVMMLLTDWSRYDTPDDIIKGVCAVSGIYDLEPIRLSYVNDDLRTTRVEAAANSPAARPLRNHCPVILAYGVNETAEFKRQSLEYRDSLHKFGEHVVCNEIANRNHFDVIMDLMNPTSWLSQNVLRQMHLR